MNPLAIFDEIAWEYTAKLASADNSMDMAYALGVLLAIEKVAGLPPPIPRAALMHRVPQVTQTAETALHRLTPAQMTEKTEAIYQQLLGRKPVYHAPSNAGGFSDAWHANAKNVSDEFRQQRAAAASTVSAATNYGVPTHQAPSTANQFEATRNFRPRVAA